MCRLPVHAAIQSKVQSICHLMADMQSKPAWSQCCVQAHASCLGEVSQTCQDFPIISPIIPLLFLSGFFHAAGRGITGAYQVLQVGCLGRLVDFNPAGAL